MVQQLTKQTVVKNAPQWKSLLAIFVGAGALLWHVLACVDSPMAYSPDGKNLAFTVAQPLPDFDDGFNENVIFRLMVLSNGNDLRTVEETSKFILTGPAYSPDGKQLCYLRLPPPSAVNSEYKEKLKAQHDKIRAAIANAGQELNTLFNEPET